MEAYSQKLTARSQVSSTLSGAESSSITLDVDAKPADPASSTSSSSFSSPLQPRQPYWKSTHFAVGQSFSTWEAELEVLLEKSAKPSERKSHGDSDEEMLPGSDLESGDSEDKSLPKRDAITCCRVARAICSEVRGACDDGSPRDSGKESGDCGCHLMSAFVCSRLLPFPVYRIGNMPVLYAKKLHAENRSVVEPTIMVGPYWPVMLCITYPLIFIVSLVCMVKLFKDKYVGWLVAVWFLSTICVIVSLFQTACRPPGLLVRKLHTTATVPPNSTVPQHLIAPPTWRWSDQANTYRPSGAQYDDECKVVCREFDHVCPWTGTAIAEDNMTAFKCFVSGICGLIVLDAILLAGGLAVLKT
jgi:hypothetical protein